jgi:hypothetical protein
MRTRKIAWVVALTWIAGATGTRAAPPVLDGARIESLTGARGQLDSASGVFKVSLARDDLAVRAPGARLTPALGLTSWAAFQPTDGGALVMGDLVLTAAQVTPVMDAALDAGLAVTGLHDHFLGESPPLRFMHVEGMGDADVLAKGVGRVFATLRRTAAAKLEAGKNPIDPGRTTLDPKKIDAVLGRPGTLQGGVYKIVIGRETRMHGTSVGAAMGVNTWAAFAGSDDHAVVDGDFAMLEGELQGVLKALRAHGIEVVAIHQHMTGEEPRILFLHYWGIGPTQALARGLRAALDQTALATP